MQLADALVTTLRDWGVQYLFGVSGANIEHVHDAVHRLGDDKLQSIFAKSEVGAAHMADCRARVHRTLGVCCATSGGGMMNLSVGIAESYTESVPVLAIVGQPPLAMEGRGAFQDSSGIGRSVDADQLWGTMTKYQAKIRSADQFSMTLEAAVRTALSDRPGPAVLMIPRDMYEREVGPRPVSLADQLEDLTYVRGASPQSIQTLFDAILAAEEPALLLGSGVDRSTDPDAVIEFARRFGMFVATTLSSKASFPNDDPLFLGTVGMAGEPSVHQYLRDQADLIVAVGTGLNALTRHPLSDVLAPERLAVVNIDKQEVLRFVQPAILLEADAGIVFGELNNLCDRQDIVPRATDRLSVTHYTPQLAPALPSFDCQPRFDRQLSFSHSTSDLPEIEEVYPEEELLQSAALSVLQNCLPTSGHVLFDAGNCAAAALHYLRIPRDVTATIALGMGGMGYSIAAAIGAQLGSDPDSRTVVFCGDGAFLMLGMEIHSAVHYQLPVLFVVFNNGMHGMCVTRQQIYFDGRLECSRYPAFSASHVARGLGSPNSLWVGTAGTPSELRRCLDDFQTNSLRPGVLELRLTREQVPPFTPFLPANAPTFSVVPVTT